MAILSRAVSVATTATRLDSTTDNDDSISGSSIIVYNNGASTIYIGGSGVTTATGTPVAASSWSPGIDLQSADALYGIVASGTVEARVFESGV